MNAQPWIAPVPPAGGPTPRPRLSAAALELARQPERRLETALVRGRTPELDLLVGWEFCGMNTMVWAGLAGIRKFVKGFFRDASGQAYGYNCPAVQDAVDQDWKVKPREAEPRRFGFYRVAPVDPTSRDNAYLHAVLLDYGRGKNSRLDPSSGLRDYLVQVGDDPDLYLGKAYYAAGPARIPVGYFVLERRRRAPAAIDR